MPRQSGRHTHTLTHTHKVFEISYIVFRSKYNACLLIGACVITLTIEKLFNQRLQHRAYSPSWHAIYNTCLRFAHMQCTAFCFNFSYPLTRLKISQIFFRFFFFYFYALCLLFAFILFFIACKATVIYVACHTMLFS